MQHQTHHQRQSLAGLLAVGLGLGVSCCALSNKVDGNIDNSSQWASSWIDLQQVTDFRRGQKIRVTLQDAATRAVLVRLLAVRDDPKDPVGIIGDRAVAVENRVATVLLDRDYYNVKQISVHGGESAWHFALGSGNAAARIKSVEVFSPKE